MRSLSCSLHITTFNGCVLMLITVLCLVLKKQEVKSPSAGNDETEEKA